MTALENLREWTILHLVVLITAAGLQGVQPLVDRTMWIREVGKIDP